MRLPRFESVEDLEKELARPSPQVVEAIARLEGDLLILGVGGKMGPTLAMMARRAIVEAGLDKRVIGVSRFSDPPLAGLPMAGLCVEDKLDRAGVETIRSDLMAQDALNSLPDVENVIYMVGMKFGTTGQEARTWAVNASLAGRVAEHLSRQACRPRVVLFSSGNVYPLTPVVGGGCKEDTLPAPIGEYAQSVLGRERIWTHFASQGNLRSVLFRLNYAVEMRYGILLDVARKVWLGEPIDLRMGHVNVLWQGDACAYALRALLLAEVPPCVLNVTGPETVSVRMLAHQFGALLGRNPVFEGVEQKDALLSNAQSAFEQMGYPSVSLGQVIQWVAAWVIDGGPVLDKPTKYGVRDGRF
jgi:nucleoside-diphosphate-sugar epimerase